MSFWLDPLAVPARISLGVLTVLTMSTQMSSAAGSSLPKVSGTFVVNGWFEVCMKNFSRDVLPLQYCISKKTVFMIKSMMKYFRYLISKPLMFG